MRPPAFSEYGQWLVRFQIAIEYCIGSSFLPQFLSFFLSFFRSIHWLTDWLTDWLIDWLIDLLTESCFPLSFVGGLICFTLRYNEVADYQDMMLELENTRRWESISKKKVPYFAAGDMPKEAEAFLYKVLKH